MPRYIHILRCLLLTLPVSLFTTSPAYPWGSKGHEIVAAIAETHLTDTARKRIKELLPQGTALADASTWPDKAGRQIPNMDPYHFINFPRDANTYDQQRDCKLRNCIIEALVWYTQVLPSPVRHGMKGVLLLKFCPPGWRYTSAPSRRVRRGSRRQ
jgi:hypothetical protein